MWHNCKSALKTEALWKEGTSEGSQQETYDSFKELQFSMVEMEECAEKCLVDSSPLIMGNWQKSLLSKKIYINAATLKRTKPRPSAIFITLLSFFLTTGFLTNSR